LERNHHGGAPLIFAAVVPDLAQSAVPPDAGQALQLLRAVARVVM
jgi:hypothetical protein